MIEVVSLVHFANPKRVQYLQRSFASFHAKYKDVRHLVLDSSPTLSVEQSAAYQRYGIEPLHMPGASYGERLRTATTLVRSDYFVFLPDDFEWIFEFPLEDAIAQARRHGVDEIKLTCRGDDWFSQSPPRPVPWFEGRRVVSGEELEPAEDLLISRRRWFKNFHEQFSLACNLMNTEFLKRVAHQITRTVASPGQAEKQAYLRLLFRRYRVAYYKMWIPAFHFIDLNVEGDTPLNRRKLAQNLSAANAEVYNRLYNR